MTKRYLYILMTYILMQLSAIPVALFLDSLQISDRTFSIIGIGWNIFSFVAALVIFLILLKPEKDLRKDPDAASFGMVIVWSLIGIFLAFFGQFFVNIIQMLLFDISPASENTQNIMEIARAVPIFIVVIAVIGPILEEIVFRKVIFGVIYKKTNFFIGALASGLIFAVVHNDFPHTLTYLAIGFVFAFVYVQSKRIIVPIIAHVTMNAVVVIIQLNIDPEELKRSIEQLEKLQMILFGG
ncbi:peptidase [Paraliobacillus quinghaiensis]|uniref:Peptidase n=1 Tax=Paraliobacillus quinghaiensis TaxID=470815 RepID=A0A917TVA3_9BACI|nr:type II CAAX endopeptidase family protein [Paraliobacillus quinghaiensis]GGM39531.1 peptidase [Paraliobacillus quinghaiensis]